MISHGRSTSRNGECMAHLVQSECFLCGKNDVNWKHSVQSASVVNVQEHDDKYWIDQVNWWAEKKAIVACKNGHLFDKACINRHEAIYAQENNNAKFPCPLCHYHELVFSKQDRKIFVPVLDQVKAFAFTKFADHKRYVEGNTIPKTTWLSLKSTPLTTKSMPGTIHAMPTTSEGMYETIDAMPIISPGRPQVHKAKTWRSRTR